MSRKEYLTGSADTSGANSAGGFLQRANWSRVAPDKVMVKSTGNDNSITSFTSRPADCVHCVSEVRIMKAR